jgi:hypothetical protein
VSQLRWTQSEFESKQLSTGPSIDDPHVSCTVEVKSTQIGSQPGIFKVRYLNLKRLADGELIPTRITIGSPPKTYEKIRAQATTSAGPCPSGPPSEEQTMYFTQLWSEEWTSAVIMDLPRDPISPNTWQIEGSDQLGRKITWDYQLTVQRLSG